MRAPPKEAERVSPGTEVDVGGAGSGGEEGEEGMVDLD